MTEQDAAVSGLDIDRKRRRRWPWFVGAGVAVVAVGAIVFVNTIGRADEGLGTTLAVATWSTDLATEKVVEFVAEEVAPDYGIVVENRRIDDLRAITDAVVSGEVAANLVFHRPVLVSSLAEAGYDVEEAVQVFTWNQAAYSREYDSWDDVPEGAQIGIRDDPAGQAISLLDLAHSGQITLKPGRDTLEDLPSLRDVDANLKNYEFVQVPIGQLARSYEDLDVIIAHIVDVYSAGLPNEDIIDSPPAPAGSESILIVSSERRGDPNLEKLIEAFGDERVQEYLRTTDDPVVRDALGPIDIDRG